jgi:DNA ligase (NAD+)
MRIVRAGDVIPEVIERVKVTRRCSPCYGKCPSCGTNVIAEGRNSLCPAKLACPAQLVAGITHYASRDALDIAGLGQETVRQRELHAALVSDFL